MEPKEIHGEHEHWTEVIRPSSNLFDLRLKELWHYRDLVMMFVKRDFISNYKQTILGPVWFFLQPLLTSITFLIIFSKIANIGTDGVPPLLFYMAGITIWNYFSETLTKTASVFRDNSQMFGKVYFPRLTMPFSIVISNLIRFGIQFILFAGIWCYYMFVKHSIQPNVYVLLTPVLVVIMGLLGLGFGMLISAMTTKYRDLVMLLTFGVQLLMYATPVIYPISKIAPNYRWLIMANPMSSIVETFRFAFTGSGSFSWGALGYSAVFSIAVLLIGTIVFNKVERGFTDTV